MKIAFDIQPLIDNEKTGVGYCEEGLITNMIAAHPETEFVLQYMSFRNPDNIKRKIENYLAPNVTLEVSRFPRYVYRLLTTFFPIPYHWLFRQKPDVTHFFNYIMPPGVRGRKIVTVHDMAFYRYPETVAAKTRWLLKLGLHKSIKRANTIVTVSEFSKREIIDYCKCSDEKVVVVYNGVDMETYNTKAEHNDIAKTLERYGIRTNDYILYLGTLEPRKNLVRLIEGYAIARSKNPNIPDLVLAGRKGWMYDNIFSKVESLSMQDVVHFIGYVPDEEKRYLLSGALCFCYPSLYEGFGMPPLEAMACGIPVIVSDTTSLPEVVGDAAIKVNPNSENSIAEAIITLCVDEKRRSECAKLGVLQSEMFSWTRMSENLFLIYKGVMS